MTPTTERGIDIGTVGSGEKKLNCFGGEYGLVVIRVKSVCEKNGNRRRRLFITLEEAAVAGKNLSKLSKSSGHSAESY